MPLHYRLVVVFAVFATVGGLMTYLLYRQDKAQEDRPSVAALSGAISPTASRVVTITLTASPLPTVDYSAVYPAQTQAAAVGAMAIAQDKIARAAATQAQATSIAIDNAGRIGTPTAVAMLTSHAVGTEQARATTDAGNRAAYFAGVAKSAAAEAEARRRATELAVGMRLIVGVVIGGIVMVIVWAIANVVVNRVNLADWRAQAGDAADDLLANLTEVDDADNQFVQISNSAYHSSRLPVDDTTFAAWASRMLAGETAGINKWERADSPFYGKRDAYIPFLAEMERREYVVDFPGRGKILSDTGRRFCEGWLARKGYTASPESENAGAGM